MTLSKLESSFPRSKMIFPNQYSSSDFRIKAAEDVTVMEVAVCSFVFEHVDSWGNRFFHLFQCLFYVLWHKSLH